MKLNLVPQTVRTTGKAKPAWFLAILLAALGIGAAVMMAIKADQSLKDAANALDQSKPQAQKAYDTSNEADAILGDPKSKRLVMNTSLATAMLKHSGVYPDMYEDVFRYNPPYFRLTSIVGTPIDAGTASITMTGTITTYQEYADMMLALMRNQRVISVSRAGFNYQELQVPPLVPTDQVGKPRKPGAAPIPDDPLLRLTYFESQPQTPLYTGMGNFGGDPSQEREAMPGESLITITMVAKYALQTPSPMATLATGGSAAPPTAAVGGAPGGAIPGGGLGTPLAPANTPAAPPTAGGKAGGRAD